MRIIAVLLLYINSGTLFLAFPQCKDISTSSPANVIEKYVLFEDAFKEKNYTEAKGPLNWLLQNAPKLNTNLYINAVETYGELASRESKAEKKAVYMDSVILVYDLRMKNCGDETNVIGRKALSFFGYYYNDPSKAKELLLLMDRAVESGGEKILDGIAENYMQAVRIGARAKLLNDEQILERYDAITSILDRKITRAASNKQLVDRYKTIQDGNFAILTSLIEMNCKFVKDKLAPVFRANPNDVQMAKRIFNFMLKGKCTDDPLWLEAAEKLHESEKDFGLAKVLAVKYLSSKDYEKSAGMLSEALGLAESGSDKAEIVGMQGHLEQLKGQYAKARDLYLKALAFDPSKKEFYARIGDLYLNSFDECKKGKSHAEDRLVFLAAYDMYQKAGEVSKMADAKTSFPSREEVHDLNYQPGDKVTVACWINEETIIRTRN
jgi:hypothetical protein